MSHGIKLISKPATFLICCLLMTSVAWAAGYQELLNQADALYEQREDTAKANQAVELYRQAHKADPTKAEAAWKLAMAIYYVTQEMKGDKKLALLEEGVAAAEEAVKLAPDSVPAHYWLGGIYGTYGQTKGVLKSLSLINPIKEAMAQVISRQPDYEDGGAYMILGRLYYKVPGFFGGSNSKALKNLNIALSYGPDKYLNHVYLAEVLMDEGEYAKAKALLDKVEKGPCLPKYRKSCQVWKNDAAELMAKLKKKMN